MPCYQKTPSFFIFILAKQIWALCLCVFADVRECVCWHADIEPPVPHSSVCVCVGVCLNQVGFVCQARRCSSCRSLIPHATVTSALLF